MFILGIYLYAVLGLQSFRGFMYSCNDPEVTTSAECIDTFTLRGEQCSFLPTFEEKEHCELHGASFPRLWAPPPENFDSLGAAVLTVFEIMTGAWARSRL